MIVADIAWWRTRLLHVAERTARDLAAVGSLGDDDLTHLRSEQGRIDDYGIVSWWTDRRHLGALLTIPAARAALADVDR